MQALKVATDTRKHAPSVLAGRNNEWFRRTLLRWYDENQRDLPWRRTQDPYAIWLSEVMLQQTRVAAVLEHYRIFLERFPNIVSLAKASVEDVLAAWSGLGYYRRARMLHKCAREIVELHGGHLPGTAESLRGLPGIGKYTAAAVASIAFGESVAVVDGNVERVLERVLGKRLGERETWKLAQTLVPQVRPGDFNQAMMELGATTCVPRQPRCLTCPVRGGCATRGELPSGKVPVPQRTREIWCALERRNEHVRLVQRSPKESLMAGMWELPLLPKPRSSARDESYWRAFRHSITVTDYTVHVIRPTRKRRKQSGKWIAARELSRLPMTGLARKILKADGII